MSRPILHTIFRRLIAIPLAAGCVAACADGPAGLKDAFDGKFLVGVAIGTDTLMRPDPDALSLIAAQYNAASPENLLKWEKVHPQLGKYDFEPADRYVAYCETHGMAAIGHTLVWHSQTPDWVFESPHGGPADRAELLGRMRNHILMVAGRYRGRIHGWDVVNEALNDDGTLRDSPWRRIIGDDYLEHAFRYAQEADPEAELYYNDYSLHLPNKRDGAARLVRSLQQAGCRVDAIGTQCHCGMSHPRLSQMEESVEVLAAVTGRVSITEFDIDVLPRPNNYQGADIAERTDSANPMLDPYKAGLPEGVQRALADRYGAFFRLFVEHADVIDRVTFWGLDDGRSWHNHWPIPGRTAHSLLFDRSLSPKPAFYSVLKAAEAARE